MDQCDMCAYMAYDEEDETYYCSVDMDQDDVSRLMSGDRRSSCPFFRDNDEYKVVKHQM